MSPRFTLKACLSIASALIAVAVTATEMTFEQKINKAHIASMISDKAQKDRGFVQASAGKGVFGLINVANRRDDCDDNGGGNDQVSCMDAVCGKMPSYLCDDASEIQKVGEICRGVGGDCVTESCKRLPSYLCDDFSEMQKITGVCKRNHGTCMKEMCDRMPSYQCDDFSEIEKVGESCRGVQSGCIASVCKRLQKYECDDLSELVKIAQSCRGN